MIPDWMIDKLARDSERREEQRPQLEIPVPPPPEKDEEQEKPQRGAVTIQII